MNTPIAFLLSRKGSGVYSVTATASVAEAVRVMNQYKIGCVIVTQAGGKLAGIFTERDVLMRVVAAGRSPEFTSMMDVMTRNPFTVSPHTTVEEVMTLFTEQRCRHLPVMDAAMGSVVGIISIGDVTRWMLESHRAEADHLKQYIAGTY